MTGIFKSRSGFPGVCCCIRPKRHWSAGNPPQLVPFLSQHSVAHSSNQGELLPALVFIQSGRGRPSIFGQVLALRITKNPAVSSKKGHSNVRKTMHVKDGRSYNACGQVNGATGSKAEFGSLLWSSFSP